MKIIYYLFLILDFKKKYKNIILEIFMKLIPIISTALFLTKDPILIDI
jgi:hypothetical protein